MLQLLVSTNAFEMLTAHLKLLLDLLSFLALLELNADVETLSWNAQLLLPSLLVSILKIINHTLLEPPLEPLELLESQLLPQFLLINHLTKTPFADHTDGIALISLKEIVLTHALMILAEMSEMEVIASGTLILMLVLAEETLIALILVLATLLLTVEIPTTISAQSTHVAVLVEFVSQFALSKLFIKLSANNVFSPLIGFQSANKSI